MGVVLDLDAAALGLAPGDPWVGGDGWTVTPVASASATAVEVAGHAAVRLAAGADGAPVTATVSVGEGLAPWTMHLVSSPVSSPEYQAPGIYAGAALTGTKMSDGGWWLQGVETGPLYGPHVLTATSQDGVVEVYVDGVAVGTGGGSTLASTVELAAYGGASHVWDVLRLLVLDEVPATLAEDMAALVEQYVPATTWIGSWTVAGAAAVTTGMEPVPPPPAGTPGGAATPPPLPEPQAPPAGVPDPVLQRVSEVMPSPTLDARGNPIDWDPETVIREAVGRIQVVVEGVDITYLDGAPLPVPSWTRTEPFGSAAATVQVPQITPFHRLPDWCVPGASVDIRIARTGGGVGDLFAGVVGTFGHRADTGLFTIECVGAIYSTDLQLRQPAFLTQPRDIGDVVAEVLNTAVSRRHDPIAPVVTGCLTSVLGGWEPRVTGYLQQLLATAVTGGRQWTVACDVRSPVLRLKDTDTISWTTHNGQRGVQIDLTQDWTKAPNVIYGEGVGNDGGRWRNAMYPNWRPDDTPLFPMAPSRFFTVGTRDAQTTTGRGVSDWQARVGQPVTGRFSQGDRQRALAVQAAAGIQRDGTVGPQTWAATFGTGSNTGTLECFYLPIAFAPNAMPRLYGPDGADLGPNPEYDPAVLRVEEKLDYGQGVDKAEGVRAASEYLARAINPGWVGRVVFEADPQETSRYLIREGSNGIIRGFRGEDLTVHVAQVDYSEDSVGLTVDTNARDFPMLDAIRERERNATDPAKAYQKRPNKGSITEARATFDAESPAGHVPRFALFSNLWSVIRVPFGAYGSIVRTELTTSGPVRPFSVAVFDRPITAARLLSLAGNPLAADENPWSEKADELDAAGLLMSWGWENQPAGYYPGEFSDPDGETEAPVTGRLVDDASWDYASSQAPWLWVAFIASGGCYVEGRFWPGAD